MGRHGEGRGYKIGLTLFMIGSFLSGLFEFLRTFFADFANAFHELSVKLCQLVLRYFKVYT